MAVVSLRYTPNNLFFLIFRSQIYLNDKSSLVLLVVSSLRIGAHTVSNINLTFPLLGPSQAKVMLNRWVSSKCQPFLDHFPQPCNLYFLLEWATSVLRPYFLIVGTNGRIYQSFITQISFVTQRKKFFRDTEDFTIDDSQSLPDYRTFWNVAFLLDEVSPLE